MRKRQMAGSDPASLSLRSYLRAIKGDVAITLPLGTVRYSDPLSPRKRVLCSELPKLPIPFFGRVSIHAASAKGSIS